MQYICTTYDCLIIFEEVRVNVELTNFSYKMSEEPILFNVAYHDLTLEQTLN